MVSETRLPESAGFSPALPGTTAAEVLHGRMILRSGADRDRAASFGVHRGAGGMIAGKESVSVVASRSVNPL
jgi:hypothetical protein